MEEKDNSENQKEEENNDFNINNDKSNPKSQLYPEFPCSVHRLHA